MIPQVSVLKNLYWPLHRKELLQLQSEHQEMGWGLLMPSQNNKCHEKLLLYKYNQNILCVIPSKGSTLEQELPLKDTEQDHNPLVVRTKHAEGEA